MHSIESFNSEQELLHIALLKLLSQVNHETLSTDGIIRMKMLVCIALFVAPSIYDQVRMI